MKLICSVLIASVLYGQTDTRVVDLSAANEHTMGPDARLITEPPFQQSSIKVDTLASPSVWTLFFSTKPGYFKPNTEYAVLFDYINEELREDSLLHCVIRDPALGDPSTLKIANMPETGKVLTKKMVVRIPSHSSFSLMFYMKKKGVARISNIRLIEGGTGKKIPAVTGAPASKHTPPVPEGPREFSIDQPTSPQLGPNAAEFGVLPEREDNFPMLNAALEACRTKGHGSLTLSPGRYFFRSDEDFISFQGLTNFTFSAPGATLIFHRPRFEKGWPFIKVSNCNRLLFTGFSIDWDWSRTPLASIVRILSVASNGESLDVEFSGYSHFPARDAHARTLEPLDTDLKLGYENSIEIGERLLRKMTWLSPNQARITVLDAYVKPTIASTYRKGHSLRLRHFNYDMGGISIVDSTHVTLSNLAIDSTPGMGVRVGGDSHHLWLYKVRIGPKPGEDRCISTTADHFHVNNSKGFIKIEESEMGLGGDDCVNIHDNNFFGVRTGPRQFLVQHYRTWATPFAIGDPIEFRNEDLSPTGKTARIVTLSENPAKEECALVLDAPVPDGGPFFVGYNRRYGSHHYIIRNSVFREHRASAFRIQADNGLIEKNRFIRAQYPAIRLETGYSMRDWCEGSGITNLVIRNNIFENCNINHKEEHGPVIHMGTFIKATASPDAKTAYPVFSSILIEGNHFSNSTGASLTVSSASSVVVRNNVFSDVAARKFALPHRAMIFISFASNIQVLNNKWIRGTHVPNPGLQYELDTTFFLTAAGNTVE